MAYISRQTGFVSIIGISLCTMPMRAGDVRSTVDHDGYGLRLFLSLSYCTSVPVKNVQNHAARLRIAQALSKVGIEKPGADCLRGKGYIKSRKNIVILCEAPLEKDKAHSRKIIFPEMRLIFSKDASYGRYHNILLYFCTPTTEFRDRFFCPYLPWKACALRQVCEHGNCVFYGNCCAD